MYLSLFTTKLLVLLSLLVFQNLFTTKTSFESNKFESNQGLKIASREHSAGMTDKLRQRMDNKLEQILQLKQEIINQKNDFVSNVPPNVFKSDGPSLSGAENLDSAHWYLPWIIVACGISGCCVAISFYFARVSKLRKKQADSKSKQLKNWLDERAKEREEATQISNVTSGIVHDINNYLTVISNVAEVGIRSSEREKKNLQFETISEVVQETGRISRRLSHYVEGGRPKQMQYELRTLIQRFETCLREVAGANVSVVFDLKSSAFAMLDPAHIKQVLTNIVLNASEAFEPEHDAPEICIELDVMLCEEVVPVSAKSSEFCEHVYSRIRVIDNGTGMDDAEISKCVEPYFSTKKNGRGLGLSSTSAILKFFNGIIDISSIEGKGTTVDIYLPINSLKTPSMTTQNEELDSEFKNLNVLVVEQDPLVREFISQALTHDVARLTEVAEYSNALDFLLNNSNFVDLLVINPEQTGSEEDQMDKIRNQLEDFGFYGPVLFVTDRLNFRSDDRVLPMPFSRYQFFNKVRKLRVVNGKIREKAKDSIAEFS